MGNLENFMNRRPYNGSPWTGDPADEPPFQPISKYAMYYGVLILLGYSRLLHYG